MKKEWFVPGRYDTELGLQAGQWTVQELLSIHPVKTLLSLGPSTGINEYVIAAQNPQIILTLIEANRDALQKIQEGIWPIHDAELKKALATNMASKGIDAYVKENDDGFFALKKPQNIRYVNNRYPIPLEETFDACLAFNSMPAGCPDGEAYELWKWVFERINIDGLFLNEWGAFTKTRTGIRRILRSESERNAKDHVETVINREIFGM